MNNQKNASSSQPFAYNLADLQQLAADTVAQAKKMGADESVVNIAEHIGLSVNVRNMAAESSEYAHDKSMSISVSINKQNGTATTSDLQPSSIKEAIEAAMAIARYTSPDPFSGLPEAGDYATDFPPLDLYHPWALDMAAATQMACDCEALARSLDKRIVNSDGVSVATGVSQSVLANSMGFNYGDCSSHHSVSCALIAEDAQGMQRDGWYEDSRLPIAESLQKAVAHQAVQRTLRRLSARRVATCKVPLIFDHSTAPGLIRAMIRAASGGALYRKASFLLDKLDQAIFPSFINISEDPFIPQGLASRHCDDEGVKVSPRQFIENGVLKGYFLSSYSARKLGMKNTGHAGGAHNVRVRCQASAHQQSLADIIRAMPRAFLVTEMMGQGINMVTGDYSRGASGFWIENGNIQHAVEEVTIAGNLVDMFRQIQTISSDSLNRGGMDCGAIVVDGMTLAGE